jgi:putative copper export protein
VTGWTLVRFLHLLAMAFFVGGQLMLLLVVAPSVRRLGSEEEMRAVARRFGIGSAAALAVLIATGAAMASHFDRWDDSVLQVKLGLLVLVFVLMGLHVVAPKARWLSWGVATLSVVIAWLGVKLVWG